MTGKRIIAVTGATGAQGGGLVRAILADPEGGFAVRALTRNTGSAKARALAEQGADVVTADLDNEDSLRRAFDGAHGAFCVTNFWEHFSPEREQDQARNMARAARHCGLQHVIWSTLEDVRDWYPLADATLPTLNGKYKVPHFDGKGAVDHVFTDLGVPTTFLRVSFYWENLIYFGMGPRRNGAGALAFSLPLGAARLPGIAAEDIGKCAYGIFKGGRRFAGRTVGIAGDSLTGEQMAAALAEALHADVRFVDMSPADYRALGFPGADELGNMFQFQLEHNETFCNSRSVEETRQLNPAVQDFPTWLASNADRIPLD